MAKEIEVLDEEETKKSKKKKKVSVKIALVFFLISLITSGFLIYNIFYRRIKWELLLLQQVQEDI